MSRIGFFLPPAHGHVNPVLPVIRELVRRGEMVTCWSHEDFRARLERAGASFRPCPPSDFTPVEIARRIAGGNLVRVTDLIFRATEEMLPALLVEVAAERPDLIVYDAMALWGRMIARRLGIRGAASIPLLVMDERQLGLRELLRTVAYAVPLLPRLLSARRRLRRQYGAAFPGKGPIFPLRDELSLAFTLRALQPDTPLIDESFRFVGPSIDPESRIETFPFELLGDGPVVYLSLGTIHRPGDEFLRACFEAFGDHPARFVVAAGRDPASIGPAPANFVVRDSVPQLAILGRAAAFVTHGGINSVQESLYYGVPMVVIPHQLEQLLNARVVARQGAGVVLEERIRRRPIRAAELRRSLDQVLGDPSYEAAAATLSVAMRATGGYRQAADEIQRHLVTAPGRGAVAS